MKNKAFTKMLDYDDLMHTLSLVDYDTMSEIMELSLNEILYFAVVGYRQHVGIKEGIKNE